MTGRTHPALAIFIGLLLERITVLVGWPILPMELTFQSGQVVVPAYILAIAALTLGRFIPVWMKLVRGIDQPFFIDW